MKRLIFALLLVLSFNVAFAGKTGKSCNYILNLDARDPDPKVTKVFTSKRTQTNIIDVLITFNPNLKFEDLDTDTQQNILRFREHEQFAKYALSQLAFELHSERRQPGPLARLLRYDKGVMFHLVKSKPELFPTNMEELLEPSGHQGIYQIDQTIYDFILRHPHIVAGVERFDNYAKTVRTLSKEAKEAAKASNMKLTVTLADGTTHLSLSIQGTDLDTFLNVYHEEMLEDEISDLDIMDFDIYGSDDTVTFQSLNPEATPKHLKVWVSAIKRHLADKYDLLIEDTK